MDPLDPSSLSEPLASCVYRLEQGENLEENQRNLLQITERFFQAIIGSSTEFPPQLRSVCHCLYQVGPGSLCPPPTPLLLIQPVCTHLCACSLAHNHELS